ncbi:MAG TPA: helix-turn-helix transcriptional regulator [Actinocrinis sp.]|nr:helix-turn-helix transcriptional regulator [Actinocrinis sp.]
MARTPRPVDPAEGPVQAFAHDLRALREAAGNPTYRALAKTAGFSATTLGDAAGGVRLPSLEVTLAYVGACGGDTEAWRIRRQELSRRLAAERGGTRGGAEDIQAADSGGTDGAMDADADVVADSEVESSAVADGELVATGAGEDEDAASVTGATAATGAAITGTSQGEDTANVTGATAAVDATRTGPEAETAATETTATDPDSRAADPKPARRRIRRPAFAAGALLLTAGALLAWWSAAPRHPAAAPTAAVPGPTLSATALPIACPTSAPTPGVFTGVTYEPATKVRAGATTAATIVAQVPAGCTLRFTGFCLGEVVESGYSGSPDMRWFELAGGGVVASAVLHGDPPAGMTPSPCPGSVPPPAAISLAAAAPTAGGTGEITLQATGNLVWIVGFAAYYPGAPGETPQWHQLSITAQGTPYFTAQLKTAVPGGASGQAGIPIVADACLGGTATTPVVAARMLEPADPAALGPVSLAAADLTAAESKACAYPSVT